MPSEEDGFLLIKNTVEIRISVTLYYFYLYPSLINKNMLDLNYNLIKQEIESEVCEEHGLHPEFVKTDEGFGIKACCDPFREKMVEKSGKMIEEETKKILDEMMKDLFKE
ncbi:hypothetical protein F3J23_11605 [Chryseobacterium sp. Tr-659]|uniref:hypothetical protein n=1 Tax=Chryseobacterium sp. Tr-659 TaxID=2608340 RepID=UPI0014230A6F|nr:hypothetical protein [Chryseobacterium sp. Tr-659]NIF06085.1 hypothetical protein [Chryseobacterium sp. Tr-659]